MNIWTTFYSAKPRLTLESSMEITMFLIRGKNFEIFDPVIIFYAINMVNLFTRRKESTYMFFHNKSMFTNISFLCTAWVGWIINKNISFWGLRPSSLPRTRKISKFRKVGSDPSSQRNFYFFFMFNRKSLSLFCNRNFLLGFFRMFISRVTHINNISADFLKSRSFCHAS